MSLKEQLRADMIAAMRTGDNEKRDVLRMVLAALKQVEVDEQTVLDDAGVQAVVTRQAKQRRESIADYEKAGRSDLIAQEQRELAVIESYLPEMMSREEVEAAAAAVIVEVGASDVKAMGQVMARLMPRLQGKADGRLISEVVRALLQRP